MLASGELWPEYYNEARADYARTEIIIRTIAKAEL